MAIVMLNFIGGKGRQRIVWVKIMPYKDRGRADAYRKAYQRSWYQQHKERILARRLKKRKERELEIKDWFRMYKGELCCVACGENHPACLQFHHRDREEKSFAISNAVMGGMSISAVMKEIGKCDVLCVNCHAKWHWCEEHR